MISRSTRGSAPAERMARACRSASVNRACEWTRSRWVAPRSYGVSRMQENSRPARWIKNIADIAVIVLIVVAAKTALAEPFYVPSGSMEPTLLIGDELLATKFPYGYGTASLPSFIDVTPSERVLAALPKRGDVVVFRWPGDPSQTWVKRVIGLPGDRIALHNGRVYINGDAVGLKPDGDGEMKLDDGSMTSAARYIETLPGGR